MLCTSKRLSLHQPTLLLPRHLSHCPSKAKMLSPAVQEQLQVGWCRELSPAGWLMLLSLHFSFKFCCVQQDCRKITSQESGKRSRCSDSSAWTTGQELGGVARPLVLFSLWLPVTEATPQANAALQRCLITASRVAGRQLEGTSWHSRALQGELLGHETGLSSSRSHCHILCRRRKVEPPRLSAGRGRAQAGETAPG